MLAEGLENAMLFLGIIKLITPRQGTLKKTIRESRQMERTNARKTNGLSNQQFPKLRLIKQWSNPIHVLPTAALYQETQNRGFLCLRKNMQKCLVSSERKRFAMHDMLNGVIDKQPWC